MRLIELRLEQHFQWRCVAVTDGGLFAVERDEPEDAWLDMITWCHDNEVPTVGFAQTKPPLIFTRIAREMIQGDILRIAYNSKVSYWLTMFGRLENESFVASKHGASRGGPYHALVLFLNENPKNQSAQAALLHTHS